MAAADVRLIVLATVRDLEPATGYAVRKHLVDEGIEAWAGIGTASIYSVLRTLTRHAHLEELPDPTGVRRDTKAYRTTSSGRDELQRLWRQAVETISPAQPLAFHVAITLTALVTRDDYVDALRTRLAGLDNRSAPPPQSLPAQVAHAARLWGDLAAAEIAWIRETIALAQAEPERMGFADR